MHDAICFARNLHVRACTAAHIHACGLSCEVSHRTIQSGNSFGNSSGIAYISRNRFGNCRDCNSRTMRMRYRYRCRCRMPMPNSKLYSYSSAMSDTVPPCRIFGCDLAERDIHVIGRDRKYLRSSNEKEFPHVSPPKSG